MMRWAGVLLSGLFVLVGCHSEAPPAEVEVAPPAPIAEAKPKPKTDPARLRAALLGEEPPTAAAPKARRGKATEELRALYQDPAKHEVAPRERRSAPPGARAIIADEEQRQLAPSRPGLDDADNARDARVIARTLAQHQSAFRACIDNELRRNPTFKGGKVHLKATLEPRGRVTNPTIDRADIDSSELGRCLKEKARRIVFPAARDSTDLEIPLILTGA